MRLSQSATLAISLAAGAAALPAYPPQSSQLPTVDLGYELHRALDYDSSADFYKFQNVRYAQAPTGELRFREPQRPRTNRTAVQDGAGKLVSCPQGVPSWQWQSIFGSVPFANGEETFDLQKWESALANAPNKFPGNVNVNSTEDCLMLDVYAPRKAFERASKASKSPKDGAPVLIWIHGGGNVLGSKTGIPFPSEDPTSIIKYSQQESDTGVIVVQINYRLGALGWLVSDEVKKDGSLNVGLLDQRRALDWVQDNIHLFGGSADRVTVMGESGGAGYIMLHETAYGGKKGPAPFSQAIQQSAARISDIGVSEAGYTSFLKQTNATSISQIRKMSSQAVIDANAINIQNAPRTTWYYAPVVDGSYIPAPAPQLFKSGGYDKNVKVLVGANSFEGGWFFDPSVKTEADLKRWIKTSVVGLSDKQIDFLTTSLYPAVYDGSLGYVDIASRQMKLFGDAFFDCNAELLNKFYPTSSAYEFSVTPGYHTQDLSYTFSGQVAHPAAQVTLQRAIASFAVKGAPQLYTANSTKPSPFPTWDPKTRRVVNITADGSSIGTRPVNQTRCDWWLSGIFQH